MKYEKAVKIAVAALQDKMKRYTFDANMSVYLGPKATEAQRRAEQNYKELADAIKTLEAGQAQMSLFEIQEIDPP